MLPNVAGDDQGQDLTRRQRIQMYQRVEEGDLGRILMHLLHLPRIQIRQRVAGVLECFWLRVVVAHVGCCGNDSFEVWGAWWICVMEKRCSV